jgi:hypothetical protein
LVYGGEVALEISVWDYAAWIKDDASVVCGSYMAVSVCRSSAPRTTTVLMTWLALEWYRFGSTTLEVLLASW